VISRRLLLAPLLAGTGVAVSVLPPPPALAVRPPARGARSDAVPLVMLDPGHGGRDPGAIGVAGTYEKHVALATAGDLQRLLSADGRYRVALTRARDVFVPLEERVGLAQRAGAALFVSMHADALADHAVRGASVYTLAAQASDLQTAALARSENAADRFAGSAAFGDMTPEVARILASLVRQETRAGSARMARSVVDEVGRALALLPHPQRHADFVVLKAADIPSVLVEMGFMSNRDDEAALRQVRHRAVVAAALRRAIDAYFAEPGLPQASPTRTAS
jgi:N-acetylmuramoyl-L-alanine amidase